MSTQGILYNVLLEIYLYATRGVTLILVRFLEHSVVKLVLRLKLR